VRRLALLALAVACGAEAPAERPPAPAVEVACAAPEAAVELDHVVFVTRDLAAAVDSIRALGFAVKPGRPHPGGLRNAHVKFRSAQEVELTTVKGPPADAMTRRYAELLEAGEGGAYLALAASLDSVAYRAAARGLHPAAGGSGPFRWVSFPEDSAAMAVFFGDRATVFDPDSLLDHPNGARGIEAAWVEGGAALVGLLRDLGAVDCGRVAGGRRLALANATVVVLEGPAGRRPRLVTARLDGPEPRWMGPRLPTSP
jgi:hypothetical protein